MPNQAGTIYAISAEGTPLVKIGCTAGPIEKRVKQLQTGHPFPLKVLASIAVETNLHKIERLIHSFLAQEKRQGEWFETRVDTPMLEALILRAVLYLANEEAPTLASPTPHKVPRESSHGIILPNRILALREQYKVPRVELAEFLDVDYGTVYRWEAETLGMSLDSILKIARYFEVAPCDVVPELGKKQQRYEVLSV